MKTSEANRRVTQLDQRVVRRSTGLCVGWAVLLPLMLAILACQGDGTSAVAPGSVAAPPVVVALGDSLTAGPGLEPGQTYPALLQERARRENYPHRFVNAGVSGDTSADALRRFDRAVVSDTRVLIVAVGANDGLQGVPVDVVKRNVSEIVERAQARNIRVLLCGMETPPNRGLDYTIAFHWIFPEIAEQYRVPLMPFLLTGVVGDPAFNLGDRIHPNAAGARRIAENMWPYLEPLLR